MGHISKSLLNAWRLKCTEEGDNLVFSFDEDLPLGGNFLDVSEQSFLESLNAQAEKNDRAEKDRAEEDRAKKDHAKNCRHKYGKSEESPYNGRALVCEFVGKVSHITDVSLERLKDMLCAETCKKSTQDLDTMTPESGIPEISSSKKVKTEESKHERKRLLILENMGINWVQVLATELNVPLSIFAQHWASPYGHDSGKIRVPLCQNLRNHFMLSYDQFYPYKTTVLKQDFSATFRPECHANRTVSIGISHRNVNDEDGKEKLLGPRPVMVQHRLTFWRIEEFNSSWDGIVLVDPPLVPKGRSIKSAVYIAGGDSKGRHQYQPLVYLTDSKFKELSGPTPRLSLLNGTNARLEGKSMLDDLRALGHLEVFENPSNVAFGCRQLVLARSATTMQLAFDNAFESTFQSAGLDLHLMKTTNYKNFDIRPWDSKWEGRVFTKLWEHKEELEQMRYRLLRNIQTIQTLRRSHISETYMALVDPCSLKSLTRAYAEEGELDEWKELDGTAQYILGLISRTFESYLQTVSARQAQDSNAQAVFIGQLTKMATVFVPVSLIAAIFSMAGNFAAGSSKFWVFWTISMPIAIGIILWIFGKDVYTGAKKKWNSRKVKQKKTSTV